MEIVQKGRYYSLKHSYRSGRRVITKEVYLGLDIPPNIEQIKKTLLMQSKKGLFERLARIKNNFSKEWKGYPESVKRELLIDFSVEFTYNTNAIEGSTITKEETDDLLKRKISPHKPLCDVQESLRHSEVFFEAINEKNELGINMIKEWHCRIFSESKPDIAGKFRDYNVRIGDYRCSDWQDVEKMMNDLVEWYHKNKGTEHPVELAAIIHYRFEKIHPFGDGNGRIGRLLINFILCKAGYPLIVIEYKKRHSYYKALQRDEARFTNYLARRFIAMHKRYLAGSWSMSDKEADNILRDIRKRGARWKIKSV